MKVALATTYGGSEVLNIKDIPQPKPQKGQVLVEVHAAGVNPFDLKILSGVYQKMMPLKFPYTPGGDFAGVIADVGEGVTEFKPGDEAYGTAIVLSGGSGSFAEYAVAGVNKISIKPKTVSFVQAAALPVAGLTAVEAVIDHMKLKQGYKILIHGGAGGVGHFAIQLAKSLGAFVATTVSEDSTVKAKEMGCDIVIDYKKQDFSKELKDYNAVLDVVGGDVMEKSYTILKSGGIYVSTVGQINEELGNTRNIVSINQNTNTDTSPLKRLASLVDTGKIKPHVGKIFSLDQVGDAFDYQKAGHPRCKIVIEVRK